jgi:hypothetical protein
MNFHINLLVILSLINAVLGKMISLPFLNKTGGLFVTIKTFPSRTCVGQASETLLRELGSCYLTADGLAGSLYQCVKKGGFVLQLLRKNCDSTGVTEPEFRESREMLIRNNDCIFASSINRWVTIQCNDATIIEKIDVSPLVEIQEIKTDHNHF